MAQYSHLNVYKKAFDLLVQITQQTARFPREFRHTLGEKLNDLNLEFIVNIYKANTYKGEDRRDSILLLLEKTEHNNILIRLSCELKILSKEKYTELIMMTSEVKKQLHGWLNYTEMEIQNAPEIDKKSSKSSTTETDKTSSNLVLN